MSDTTLPAPGSSDPLETIGTVLGNCADELSEAKRRISSLERDLANAKARHRDDVALIGERLIELANDNDWCDTYDDEVDRLNEHLNVELPTRTKAFEVKVEFYLNVTARSSSDAEESADQWGQKAHTALDGSYGDGDIEADRYDVLDVS